ncbi:Bacteriophage holin [Bacillus subtilis]|nr:phage holin [Bacillus pacificus]CUB50837.1 Bacteriophage holin [Bacillus subtilis]
MKETTKKKLKTTVFWSGIASATLIFLQSLATLFGYELPQDTVAKVMGAVNSLLALLTFSGVLVNPEHVESFQVMVAKRKKD